jgi:hypothetical protein
MRNFSITVATIRGPAVVGAASRRFARRVLTHKPRHRAARRRSYRAVHTFLTTACLVMSLSATTAAGDGAFSASGPYLKVRVSASRPQIEELSIDGLGRGHFRANALRDAAAAAQRTADDVNRADSSWEYRRHSVNPSAPARWTIRLDGSALTLVSHWTEADPPEPIALDFNPKLSRATLLGTLTPDGAVRLPAILHLPGQGTARITAVGDPGATLGYDAARSGKEFITVTFPPADKKRPRVEYHVEAVSVHPPGAGIDDDRRFDGFRRNWLNILQLNPRLRALSNNSSSDTCAFCYYQYADVARHTPPLATSQPGALASRPLLALDIVRQTLDRILAGGKAYGMPDYSYDMGLNSSFPQPSLDTYPSLLIAARDCASDEAGKAWLEKNYAGVKQWADKMLAQDRDGNGLIEFHLSGNSGSWLTAPGLRPSNWWDTIGYGHEDAYANALAYRALNCMAALAKQLGKSDDVARYTAAADKLRAAYFNGFYNPATGVLAGWKSADGKLHDYCFLPVNGIAIHYGLVPKDKANAVMDKLLAKMKQVGYTRFDLGLPGNLIPVARKDYVDLNPRFGGGAKEDNSDGFQIYENGGATACHAFFTIAALYDLGRRDEADNILFPMLDSFEKGRFEGTAANGMSNDWKAWDGTPWGYEGFLVDGYYAMLAVLVRSGEGELGIRD